MIVNKLFEYTFYWIYEPSNLNAVQKKGGSAIPSLGKGRKG